MPVSRTRKPKAEFMDLAISIDCYNARAHAGINLNLLGSSRYVLDDEELVYSFETVLELNGNCTYPDTRAGDRYDITLLGDSITQRNLRLKIKDLQERDKNGVPQYRKLRNTSYPVYREPPALAFLDKVRGENRWTLWAWVAQPMITDCLMLLSGGKQIYVSLREKKENRQRQIRALSIQTTNPADE